MVSQTFWQGKAVIVSGGSSGIGLAAARAAGRAGARLGLIARDGSRLEEAAAEIGTCGVELVTATADVCDREATRRAVASIEEVIGPCEVAIASAGIYRLARPLRAAVIEEVLQTNVVGMASLFEAVLPGMRQRRRGRLCGIASIAALIGLPGGAAYSASKAAAVAMLESLRVDLLGSGITVTTVCPGFVDTPMVTDAERRRWDILTADEAATEILRAIRRGHAERWFPFSTWLTATLARALPRGLYARIAAGMLPLEET